MKTSEIKVKVSAKLDKAKSKIAAKCGKAAKCAVLLLSACCLHGCSTADAPTAAKAQNISAEDIYTYVIVSGDNWPTNQNPVNVTVNVEIATAAQANETSGTDTLNATNTQTPTTDIKPTTTFTYGLCSTGAGNDWIADLTSASARGLASWLRSGNANGTMTLTKKDGTTETVTCKDGTCYPSTCSECVTCSDCASCEKCTK